MIVYPILELPIMNVPYQAKWGKNKVLFVDYRLYDDDLSHSISVSAHFDILKRMESLDDRKKGNVSNRSIGDRIFCELKFTHDNEWPTEVFVDQESVADRIRELELKLPKIPELAPLISLLQVSMPHLPRRSEIGYSLDA